MSQFMTKDQWMDYLAAQIQGDKTIVRTASRLMKSDSGQEIASPYVGLASIRDIIQKHSTTGDKHVCNLGLFIKTKTSADLDGWRVKGDPRKAGEKTPWSRFAG